jgi:hypothetical protein
LRKRLLDSLSQLQRQIQKRLRKKFWKAYLKIPMTAIVMMQKGGGEDSEDRPWRPSHAVFGKSTIRQSHLDNMRGRYFRDISIVRADNGDMTVPVPEENEVVIY